MSAPTAFLCHSSIDKPVARPIAEGLMANGVNTFFDQWSIEPGDSLRRKIEAGIAGANYFVALISKNSLQSEWVQTELDMALVAKIEGQSRLVPLFFGIPPESAPLSIRSVAGIRVDGIDDTVRRLVSLCHGLSETPPLGPAPPKIRIPRSGLSPVAARIAVLLAERSETGARSDPMILLDDIASELGLPEQDSEDAADELEQHGLVRIDHVYMGRDIATLSPSNRLFWTIDPVTRGFDSSADSVVVASVLLNSPSDDSDLDLLRTQLGWDVRRLNPAITFLVEHGYVTASAAINTYPYAYDSVTRTPRTRRFVKENSR